MDQNFLDKSREIQWEKSAGQHWQVFVVFYGIAFGI